MRKGAGGLYARIREYVKTHIGVPMTLSIIFMLLMAMLILQSYVKNKYFDYLLEETGRAEQAVLTASTANINNALQDVVETACSIAINSSLRNRVETIREIDGDSARKNLMLKEELTLMSHYSNSIVAVTVAGADGLIQEYGRYWEGGGYSKLWTGDNLELLDGLYDETMSFLNQPMIPKYCVSEQPSSHESMPDSRLFHLALPLVGGSSDLSGVTDMVVVSFRLDSIVDSGTFSGYLTGDDGEIIYNEDEEQAGISDTEYRSLYPENETLTEELDYFGWEAHVMIDINGMHDRVNQMYQTSILVYLLLLCLCGLIWQVVLGKILKPVGRIRDAMRHIRLGGHREKIEIGGSHEIWQLAQDYNTMLDSLHSQQKEIDRQYKEKTASIRQKNRAEREALESQINAHFLCNTLTAINYNAIENEDYEVATLLKKLSNMLSYSFSRGFSTICLGQEIQWVEEYLYLQKFRLMEVFDYRIDFPEEYGDWPSCKLFLQPFVENSILHGFEGRERGGQIEIEGRPQEKRFRLSLRDNGCGMKPEIAAVIQKILAGTSPQELELNGCGIGIRNVVTRLRMYFGEDLEIAMETAPGEGTCFTFLLPLVEEKRGSEG